jgi:hypothetical protein
MSDDKKPTATECYDAVARSFWLDYWKKMEPIEVNDAPRAYRDDWILAQTERCLREEARQPLGLPKWAADRMASQEREIGKLQGDLVSTQSALTTALVSREDMYRSLIKARATIRKMRAALIEMDKEPP